MTFAAIVVSARPRSGKTLLARLVAENFLLSGLSPQVFDTDAAEQRLWSFFSRSALVVDFDRVADQMRLIEAMVAPGEQPRVVEVSQRASQKFFDVLRASDYVREARANDVEPVVFFIPSTDPDSFEYGRRLHEHLGDCIFVLAQNAYLGEVKLFTKLGVGYRALEHLRPRMLLTAFDPSLEDAMSDPGLAFSEFVRDPPTDLPLDMRDAIRDWLLRSFKQTYGVIQTIEAMPRRRAEAQRDQG